MKHDSTVRVLAWLGVLMLVAGIAMVGYVIYASASGVVYTASRSTEATIYLDQSPQAFIIAIALYLAGGILFLWIARVLLPRKKKAT